MTTHTKVILVFWALFQWPFFVFCQSDSIPKAKYPSRYFTEYDVDRNLDSKLEDTTINQNEIYHPYYRNYGIFQDLGNIGTPGRSMFFTHNRPTDFVLGFNPYQVFYKRPEDTKYYKTKLPYSDFNYTQGQRDVLLFAAKFAYNLSPRLNVGVDYNRVTSLGFYPRQYTSGYFTKLFGSYESKNRRYGLLANMNWNRGLLDENGGIRSDSLFESLTGANKAAPVQLTRSQSRYRNSILYAKQYFYLGKMNTEIKEEDTSYFMSRNGFIAHTFKYEKDNYFFDNPAGDTSSVLFPANSDIDSSGIFYDSIGSSSISNKLSYAYWTKSNERQQSFVEFALSHKYIEVRQMETFRTYNNVIGEANIERIPKNENNIGFKLHGSYCFTGYNQNDFKLAAEALYSNKLFAFTGGFTNQLYTPDYTHVYYRSAPFSWNNNYSKINVTNWRVGFQTKQFRHNFYANFNQYIIANWVYNGLQVNPEQSNKILVVNTLEASKTFQASILFFEHKIWVQQTNLDLLRVPTFGGFARYYLAGKIFKKVLELQVGAEVFYNTAFYGNAYHPSARVFHLQNQVQIGNYPMFDVFLTGKVMTAIIYVKYEHANMDWIRTGFYNTPHYPLPVRVFRLGLRLRLYN
ncbi:MAG: putative porin [Bacteroidia bacterium]|nr:putative porin [Bacteroidia bacterium]